MVIDFAAIRRAAALRAQGAIDESETDEERRRRHLREADGWGRRR